MANKKGKVIQVELDAELEEMIRNKEAADAARELKDRLRAKRTRLTQASTRPSLAQSRKQCIYSLLPSDTFSLTRPQVKDLKEAPPLPIDNDQASQPRDSKEGMQDFLDELLG